MDHVVEVEQTRFCSTFFITMPRFIRFLLVFLIIGFLGFLYFRTLAPGLTWAYDSADSGDLVTAAVMRGVPHPTGYPTYLLVASAFLRIPLGTFAYRTNILSLVSTIAATLMIYRIVLTTNKGALSAWTASLAFGTFPLIWSQAIITEVNALHALFVTLILYCCVATSAHPLADILGGIMAGLSIGNHMSTVLILPLMAMSKPLSPNLSVSGQAGERRSSGHIKLVARRLLGLCLGLIVYLLIPFRAAKQAPVNWGNAVDWNGFTWLVTGKMYWGRLGDFNGGDIWTAVEAWSHFLVLQLGAIGLLLIFITLGVLFSRSRCYVATGWLAVVYSVFSILYSSPDSYVYLIPVLISFSIWIGLGSNWIAERVARRNADFKPIIMLGISALIVLGAILRIPAMDLSANRIAEEYAETILRTAPPRAIIITDGDEETFVLWYFHYVYHQRPDVAVISSDLLLQPWYHAVLKDTYRDLVVPDDALAQGLIFANPRRTPCHLAPDLQPRLDCSG